MGPGLAAGDIAHEFLLGRTLPLLLWPPSLAPRNAQLRGVVRSAAKTSRVILTNDPQMLQGVAFQLDLDSLFRDGSLQPVFEVLTRIREVSDQEIDRTLGNEALPRDSHSNNIVAFPDIVSHVGDCLPDHNLHLLLDLLHRGVIAGASNDVYTFTGFMLQPHYRCRLYVRLSDATTLGLEIPYAKGERHPVAGLSASLSHELDAKLRSDGVLYDPIIDRSDDYCNLVYDLASWFGM